MSKHVKSQLELYMDGLEGASEEEPLCEIEKSGQVCDLQEAVAWGVFTLCILVTGLLEDSIHITKQVGSFNVKVRSIACVDLPVVCVRRVMQVLVTIRITRQIVFNYMDTSSSTTFWAVYQCCILVFYLLVLLPLCIGMVNYWLIRLTKQKLQLAQLNTERLLSVIKRTQLVRMGSSISHPMPPVAKLEETFLRTNSSNEAVLSCREMRNSLLRALTRLKSAICCGESITTSDTVLVAIGHLERLMAETFQGEVEGRLESEVSALMTMLASLKTSCWETIGYQSTLIAKEESVLEAKETRADVWFLFSQCAECVLVMLSFPLQLSMINDELDVYLQTCKSISGALYQSNVSNNISNEIRSSAEQPHIAMHSYADTYLAARQKIARLRASYEDMSTRLWLADQQLCAAPVLQCLLPDHLETTSNGAELRAKERVLHLDVALDTLSHNTRTSLSPSLYNIPLTHNEVLEGVELLLAGLPTLRDFELLCEDLQLIREASVSGSTPAQCKLDHSSNEESFNMTPTVGINDTASTTNSITEAQRRDPATQGVYEANNFTGEVTARPAGATNSLDPTQTSSILDIYTTVIPRRTAPIKTTAIDTVDAAVAAQERAQAKKLFRELNQHLRRMHGPSALPVSQPRLSTHTDGPDSGSMNQVDSPVIPATGCYTQQRVRHIGTSEPENGDFADEMEVQIETNFTQVDPTALGLCEDSDSEVEDDFQDHCQARDRGVEVKAFRMGTMLLTDEELRASNLTSSPAPSHSTLEFQNEMRQALLGMQRATPFNGPHAGGSDHNGLPLSAFASALRSNHLQEATFGDELSD